MILKELTRAHEVYPTFYGENFDVFKMRLLARIFRQFNLCSEVHFEYPKIHTICDYLTEMQVLNSDEMRAKSDEVLARTVCSHDSSSR